MKRTETQYAIRTGGFPGEFYYNPLRIGMSHRDAVWECSLYREIYNPTVVSRTVTITEDKWEEVTV